MKRQTPYGPKEGDDAINLPPGIPITLQPLPAVHHGYWALVILEVLNVALLLVMLVDRSEYRALSGYPIMCSVVAAFVLHVLRVCFSEPGTRAVFRAGASCAVHLIQAIEEHVPHATVLFDMADTLERHMVIERIARRSQSHVLHLYVVRHEGRDFICSHEQMQAVYPRAFKSGTVAFLPFDCEVPLTTFHLPETGLAGMGRKFYAIVLHVSSGPDATHS